MKDFKQSIKLFIASIVMCIFVFPVFAQSLNLMPKDSELVDKREQKQGEIVIKTYKFHSQSTVEQINEFYKKLFSNEGFGEAKQQGLNENIQVFTKANSIASLNFVPDYEDKSAAYYYIQIQEFPVNVKSEDNSLQTNKSQKPVNKEIKQEAQPQ
jgi:hypothetical protein